MSPSRIGNLVILLLLAVLFAGAARPVFRGEIFADFDLREQFMPSRIFYSVALERGSLGSWNPFLRRGYNHLGEGQGGTLHPMHLLSYRFLPLELALLLEMYGHYLLAIAGMWLLLGRVLRLGSAASLTGAGLFAFSAFMVARFTHLNMAWVYAHLPWALACTSLVLQGRRAWLWSAALAVAFGSMLLLGHPQMVWLNSLAIGSWWLFNVLAAENRRPLLGRSAMLVAGLIVGVLLGMPQLLCTALYLTDSPRAHLTWLERNNFSLPPLNLLVSLAPFILQYQVAGDIVHTAAQQDYLISLQEFPAYFGIGCISVCLYALLWYPPPCRRAATVWAAASLGAALLLALGKYGFVFGLIEHLPLVAKFRAPSRYLAIALAGAAICAAWSLARLRGAPLPRSKWRFIALFLPLLGAVSVALLMPAELPYRGTVLRRAPLLLVWIGPVLAGIALAGILVHLHRPRLRAWAAVMLAALCLADVGAYSLALLRFSPTKPTASLRSSLEAMRRCDPLVRRVSKLNEPWLAGQQLANGYLGIPPPEPLDLFGETTPQLTRHHLRLVAVTHAYGSETLFALANPLPRLRLVPELQHADEPLIAIAEIDLATTALCRADVAPELRGPPLGPDEFARLTEVCNEHVEIEASVEATRLLLLADPCRPGWQAYVDGQPAPTLALFDGVCRGFVLPPGRHRVALAYRPPGLHIGLLAAAAGILCLLLMIVLGRRRGSRTDVPPGRG